VSGRPRTATPEDLPLAVAWLRDFQTEAQVDTTADPTPVASARINRNELIWWEDQGHPVALAAVSVPIAGMSRIGPVYTPPNYRRRGYGAAITHAVTEKARKEGAAEVLLFADQANPISNSIYQRLGYRPIGDYVTIHFRTP
jgi:predicted GNAT family acetyltransferase